MRTLQMAQVQRLPADPVPDPNDPPTTLYEAHIASRPNPDRIVPNHLNPHRLAEATPVEAAARLLVDRARTEGLTWIDLICLIGFHWRMRKHRERNRDLRPATDCLPSAG